MFCFKEMHLLAVLLLSLSLLGADARVFGRQTRGAALKKTTTSTTRSTSLSAFTLKTITPTSVGSSVSVKVDVTTSSSTSNRPSSTVEPSVTSTTSSTISTASSTSTTQIEKSTSTGPAAKSTASNTPVKELIPSRVTPAFGIGGLVLILGGLVYTFIGIRFKWLHASISAAYLGALTVTILVISVSKPPVSDAVQGAYFVAIVLTGAIFGGASYFFCKFTEGLASLLGGFAFAMWLLVMRSDGLITSHAGKIVFILFFTTLAFGSYFSKYTKDYGLIFGISLGGATSVVLGFDCFTRAGLKEFWAFLWDVNPRLLPEGPLSFPITQGIKVEIASIVVIFLLGFAVQTKMWLTMQKLQSPRGSGKLDLEDGENTSQEDLTPMTTAEIQITRDVPDWPTASEEKALQDPGRHPAIRDSGLGDMDFECDEKSYEIHVPIVLDRSSAVTSDLTHPALRNTDRKSMATTVEEQVEMRQRSTRFSATSAFLRRLSKKSRRTSQPVYRGEGESSEDLVSLRTANINRSASFGATRDDASDFEDFRSARSSLNQMSPYRAEFNRTSTGESSPRTPNFSLKISSGSRLSRPFSGVTAASHFDAEPVPEITQDQIQKAEAIALDMVERLGKSDADGIESPVSVLSEESLPKTSRKSVSARTTEWAQQLESADVPAMDGNFAEDVATALVTIPPTWRASPQLTIPKRSSSAQSKVLLQHPGATGVTLQKNIARKPLAQPVISSGMTGQTFLGNGTPLATMPEFPQPIASDDTVPSLHSNSMHWSTHQPKYQPTISNLNVSAGQMSKNALAQERLAREHKRGTAAAQTKMSKEAACYERMQRDSMIESHRDALRRMQARANQIAE